MPCAYLFQTLQNRQEPQNTLQAWSCKHSVFVKQFELKSRVAINTIYACMSFLLVLSALSSRKSGLVKRVNWSPPTKDCSGMCNAFVIVFKMLIFDRVQYNFVRITWNGILQQPTSSHPISISSAQQLNGTQVCVTNIFIYFKMI